MISKESVNILNCNGLEDTFEYLESLRNIDYNNYDVMVVNSDVKIIQEKISDFMKIANIKLLDNIIYES